MITFKPSDALKRLPNQFFTRLRAKAAKLIEQGYDVINLRIENPDLPTPTFI
ncbi:MAG: hypothetical protein ABS878_02850 [Priestia megaterium]